MVDSRIDGGFKFIFTETHLTAFRYATYDFVLQEEANREYFWDDVEYVFVNDSTIKVSYYLGNPVLNSEGYQMPFVFYNKDFLLLKNVIWNGDIVGSYYAYPIWLHRRDNNEY